MTDKEKRIREFSDLGLGLVLHWGLYSMRERGEWVQNAYQIDRLEYRKAVDGFNAEGFDPKALAAAAREAGVGFIILTARHHDGFSLYDTKGLSDFDSIHSPAGRDLMLEFASACRAEGIMPVFYHTTLDWQWRGKTTIELDQKEFEEYIYYLHDSLELLCTGYGEIGGFIFDGNWCRPDSDWNYDRLYGMIRKHQPDAIIMDNTGLERPGVLDHPELDAVTFEQHAVCGKDESYGDQIAALRWLTLNDHWGWSRKDFNFKSGREIIEGLTQSRRFGAVYTLNMAPAGDGSITGLDAAVLDCLGGWMKLYGYAIRNGRPSDYKCTGRDFLQLDAVHSRGYYFCHDLGIAGHENVTANNSGLSRRCVEALSRPVESIRWMDNGEALDWRKTGGKLELDCTGFPYGENHVVRIALIEFS